MMLSASATRQQWCAERFERLRCLYQVGGRACERRCLQTHSEGSPKANTHSASSRCSWA
jgi:hypothetical protein